MIDNGTEIENEIFKIIEQIKRPISLANYNDVELIMSALKGRIPKEILPPINLKEIIEKRYVLWFDKMYTKPEEIKKIGKKYIKQIFAYVKQEKMISYEKLFNHFDMILSLNEYNINNISHLIFYLKHFYPQNFIYNDEEEAIYSLGETPYWLYHAEEYLRKVKKPVDIKKWELQFQGISNWEFWDIASKRNNIIRWGTITLYLKELLKITESQKENIEKFIINNINIRSIELYSYVTKNYPDIIEENYIEDMQTFFAFIANVFIENIPNINEELYLKNHQNLIKYISHNSGKSSFDSYIQLIDSLEKNRELYKEIL